MFFNRFRRQNNISISTVWPSGSSRVNSLIVVCCLRLLDFRGGQNRLVCIAVVLTIYTDVHSLNTHHEKAFDGTVLL